MYRKIIDSLTILSFLLISSTLVAAGISYKYFSSEQFKEKLMKEIMGNVSGMMPKVLDKGLPDMTGPSVPTTKIPSIPKF
tara:strand:+ start:339 stop:578 length:240 start_codon:yes stop_codon:yes gene_type:complete